MAFLQHGGISHIYVVETDMGWTGDIRCLPLKLPILQAPLNLNTKVLKALINFASSRRRGITT